MKLVLGSIAALLLASGAGAQDRANIPAGNPLGSGTPSVVPEQGARDRQRLELVTEARARANARAMAEAFGPVTPVTPIASQDPDVRRVAAPTFGQSIGPSNTTARPASSPYGGYYQIRTPWDPR